MGQKFTFFVVSTSGSPCRRLTISRGFLSFLVLLLVVGAAGLGWVVQDYLQLRQSVLDNDRLGSELAARMEEVRTQRKQIHNFADRINDLKSKLVELNDFEKKIRVIANIEQSPEHKGLFGVGGSIPEDLDTQMPLEQAQNGLIREMHDQADQLELAAVHQEDGFSSLLQYLEDQRNILACTPAIRPTDGWVTSRFGYRESPFTGLREFHKGLDIANREGTFIRAPADGVVAFAARKGLLGNVVIIDHGHGFVTRFGHIHKALKKRGDTVKRGEVIAEMGNTGRSTGPHLHYEVLLNGVPVNPEKYILN
ncbi:MAG: M23 family metallopeptidase [Desulfobacterales bacterium]